MSETAQTCICEAKLTEDECNLLKGNYLDDNSYDVLITEDTDAFRPDGSILFKFRKKIFDEDESELAFLAFKNLARPSRGRGASAGPIDPESVYWKKREIVKIQKGGWSTTYLTKGKESKMKVQNEVASNAMGYWSETKGLGKTLPCRLTHFSRAEFLKYEDGKSVVQKISNSYKILHPDWYEKQMNQSKMNDRMRIGDTPFSTVTVNRNFRTAVHQDAGDFGFGNLSVFEYGKYHGGYFVFPKYRIAIDMRQGAHLCADVHEFHGNTEFYETDEDKIYNDTLPDIFHDNLEIGILGLNNRFSRISLVCYLRDKLKECSMPTDESLLIRDLPAPTKLTVLFVNKKENSQQRQKFFNTNWSRCSTHQEALHRIIKHSLQNVIVIDDTCELNRRLGNAKQFTETDGVTYLNVDSDSTKGIYPYDGKSLKLAYYIPNFIIASQLLNDNREIKSYFISPKIFT